MLTFTFQLFAIACGWLEAVLYAKRGAESFTGNEHGGMTAQRLAAWLLTPAAMVVQHYLGPWGQAEIIPATLLFPLFHDEAYNFTRLWIAKRAVVETLPAWPFTAPWPLRWLDKLDCAALELAWADYQYGYQSPTTTARNDFSGRQRTWLAVAGCLLLVAGYWLLLIK
jgi:hypothetical protein